MIIWLIIAIILAILGIVDGVLNYTSPIGLMRTVMLFLLVLGMSYRIYIRERGGEMETLRQKVRELEDKAREKEMAV